MCLLIFSQGRFQTCQIIFGLLLLIYSPIPNYWLTGIIRLDPSSGQWRKINYPSWTVFSRTGLSTDCTWRTGQPVFTSSTSTSRLNLGGKYPGSTCLSLGFVLERRWHMMRKSCKGNLSSFQCKWLLLVFSGSTEVYFKEPIGLMFVSILPKMMLILILRCVISTLVLF